MLSPYLFATGIFSVAFWSQLPPLWVILLFVPAGFLLRRFWAPPSFLLLGMVYGCLWGYDTLGHQLPDEFIATDFTVIGEVYGIPVRDGRRVQFNLRLDEASTNLKLQKLRLSWYGDQASLQPGQVWQLQVRLRRPRGYVNPGGFDYQAWLIQQGFSATGYVRTSPQNRLLEQRWSLDRLRYQLQQKIAESHVNDDAQALMSALTIGDRSHISKDLWYRLSLLGVIHLLVVSGLHIGFVAAMGYGTGSLLAKCFTLICQPVNARYTGAVFSLVFALSYSALAGFSLPTQRALIMVMAALVALLANRYVGRAMIFGLALVGVALIDPLAIMGAGFWLSFGAVAGLLWLVPAVNHVPKWRLFFRVQWLMFLLLILPLAFWQLPVAWFSPLVNSVAIPWVSFLVVPLCLLGVVIIPISPGVAEWLWWLAGKQLEWFVLLTGELTVPAWLPLYSPWPLTGLSLFLMSCIAGLVLLPRGIPGRYLAIPLAVALFYLPTGRQVPLTVTVLDVGQGLSIVVQTRRHTLVYDTGPGYAGGYDAGSALVAPFLRRQGVTGLDALVVSHSDNDHAGGVAGLLRHYSPTMWLVGSPAVEETVPASEQCRAGQFWRWDDVEFRILHPADSRQKNNNNHSCVLAISYLDQVILLPGDIDASVEHRLLPQLQQMAADKKQFALLIAPHHGSKTSSSKQFLAVIRPQQVVFSAAYRHHFGHPAESVVQRYLMQGSTVWNTAEQGALIFRWQASGEFSMTAQRKQARRYWF
tara:strand:- start:35281 stop:37545 length:2265 start_codon:yes stop_codon:yes gene_type:complete